MRDTSLLGPWIRRFLMEHLIGERNLSRNTQRSYRDTLRLFLPAVAQHSRKPIDRLAVTDLSAECVRQFLSGLEKKRGCAIATRNQRLAAIHALAGFIGLRAPELVEWCGQVRAVPFKKAPRPLITYLEKSEMDALLATPDLTTAQGRRDHALLLFLYNAGTRADETAQVRIGDLTLPQVPERDLASVLIRGKGNKARRCPLWAQTVRELATLVQGRGPSEHVFLNRCGQSITRFGIHTLVKRSAIRAVNLVPSLAGKRVSPHTIRHTTATHLLRSGVD
ncbi:MAG TPA: tyrosine-type recombinase/integrase, partial [Gemmataceae bacterium]|nr:tyrosine-type recombinase/integrase [Gemmataceae bacterium]